MKVCFVGVSDSFPSYAGENTRVLQLANNLTELGVEVHIIVPRRKFNRGSKSSLDNPCKAFIHESKINFNPPRFHYVSTLPSQLRSLAKLQKSERFDLVHTNMFWGGPLGLAAKKILGACVVFDPHDWFFCDLYHIPLIDDAIERLCARKLDATLVTGSKLGRFLTARGVPPERLEVVPNGVRQELIRYPRAQECDIAKTRNALGIEESEGIVTFLGSLQYYQGVDILIRAMKHVTEHINSKLLIIGEGIERSNLEMLTRNLGLAGNVLFLGKVSWAYLIRVLDISSVAVVPFRRNRYTSWIQPIKVFEYFSREKPIIASDLPGVSEIVRDRVNGLLVPPENVELLSKALIDLLGHDALRNNMGSRGKELVLERYTWKRIAQELEKVYDRTLMRTVT